MLSVSENIQTVTLLQFKEQIRLGALRWLHSLNVDKISATYGIVDRDYWAWKTKDFPNGTWQGGLAGCLDSISLLNLTTEQIMNVVTATVTGSRKIQRKNGSFEEAYPFENSYCVTALVLFDLLYSYFLYQSYFSKDAVELLFQIVTKAEAFLKKTPETHGVIANHLATGLFALQMTNSFMGKPQDESLFKVFLELQEPNEGWFPEYGQPDPGYQTLLNHYWVAAKRTIHLPEYMTTALDKSLNFTRYFCFPDGTYAGEIGSRGTSIVYPSGTFDSDLIPSAVTGWFMQSYMTAMHAVTPTNVDAGNFVPIFNAWALTWKLLENCSIKKFPYLNFQTDTYTVKTLNRAGYHIISAPKTYMIISERNSVLRKTLKHQQEQSWKDDSLIAFTSGNYSTQLGQLYDLKISDSRISYKLSAQPIHQPLNTAFSTIILRCINICLMSFPFLQRLFKKLMASYVMKPKCSSPIEAVEVVIDLTQPDCPIMWHELGQTKSNWQPQTCGFHKHMASANTFDPRSL